MQIKVSGSNMDAGQSLTSYVEEHLAKAVTKYFDKAVNADVHFSKDGILFKALITVNEGVKGGGIVVKSDGSASDVYAAFTEAADRASKQLRRYKSRIKNYRRQGGGIKSVEPANYSIVDATKYVLPHNLFEEMEGEESDENPQDTALKVINEKTTQIEELSVDEAVMKMDLADLPALVFINAKSKRLNVVYHRKDGNISWIDPQI